MKNTMRRSIALLLILGTLSLFGCTSVPHTATDGLHVPSVTLHPDLYPTAVTTHPSAGDVPEKTSFTVVLDPGHGENDPGALGQMDPSDGFDYHEDGINYAVAACLQEILTARGYTVYLTREENGSRLHGWDTVAEAVARREYGVAQEADLYLSLHCDSYTGSGRAYGPVIFYRQGNTHAYDADTLSALMAEYIDQSMQAAFPEMRETRRKNGNEYIVLKENSMPSLLLEMGFLSDPEDLSRMIDPAWQRTLAEGLADGIDAWREIEKGDGK